MRAFSKSRRIFWNALMDFIKEERSEMRKRGTSVEEKKLRAEEKGRAVALLPIGVFLVRFLGIFSARESCSKIFMRCRQLWHS